MLNVITVSTLFNMEADSFILEGKKDCTWGVGKGLRELHEFVGECVLGAESDSV